MSDTTDNDIVGLQVIEGGKQDESPDTESKDQELELRQFLTQLNQQYQTLLQAATTAATTYTKNHLNIANLAAIEFIKRGDNITDSVFRGFEYAKEFASVSVKESKYFADNAPQDPNLMYNLDQVMKTMEEVKIKLGE